MPRGDGTGPDGNGPRNGSCRNLGQSGGGTRRGMGGHSKRNPCGGGTRVASRTTKRSGTRTKYEGGSWK